MILNNPRRTASLLRNLFLVVSALSCCSIHAATVIVGDASTNLTVHVPENKMIVVTALDSDVESAVTITRAGIGYTPGVEGFDTRFQPRYVVGPCVFAYNHEVGFDNHLINYDVFPSHGLETLLGTNSAAIQVPDGKRFRILDGSYPLWFTVTTTNGLSTRSGVSPKPMPGEAGPVCNAQGFELTGPLTLTFGVDQNDEPIPFFVTYYFAEDVIPAAGMSIQSPAGSTIVVEKSTNLDSWSPAFITTQQNEPKAFYRLRVAP